jgi:hypothetical protein
MPLQERIEHEDILLFELLRHPVLSTEFIYNVDVLEGLDEPFQFSWYQKEMLADFNPYVSLCTARATGKTVALSSMLIWLLVYKVFPDDYVLYTVPSKVHLEPVFTNLIRLFRSNSFLQQFIEKKGGINSSDYKISLLNHTTLLCRIAGQSGTGANLIGLHTPFITTDEGGYFPFNAFQEMQPSLNTFTPGYREVVAGVPTGLREKNVLYHSDKENNNYTKHRISATQNPRVSEEDRARALDQYGGEDAEDYIHYFLGLHGKPVYSLFDRSMFSIESYPVYKLELDGLKTDNLSEYIQKLMALPAVPDKDAYTIIGVDLGYTEPTAILIMYLDKYGRIKFHGKIRMSKVSYPIQEKLIDFLDTKYDPDIIGVDRGNAGLSVIQNLMEHSDYSTKDYKERLIPIDFSSWMTLGMSADGEEIRTKTKPLTVSVLQDYSNSHRLVYSSTDTDLIAELERMTYTKNASTGEIAYKTLTPRGGKRGEDHFTSALLCAVGSYYITNEFVSTKRERKPLVRAIWV